MDGEDLSRYREASEVIFRLVSVRHVGATLAARNSLCGDIFRLVRPSTLYGALLSLTQTVDECFVAAAPTTVLFLAFQSNFLF